MSNSNGNGHSADGGAPSPMSAAQFAAYIERRLSLEDAIEVLGRQEMQLRLRAHGAEMTADLSSFYNVYARDPSEIDTVVRNFVATTLGLAPDRESSDFAELADRIYPMLKPIELLVTVRERKLPMLAYREFLAQLIITYVIDEQRSVTFINDDHLERWGVALVDVHEQAISNLRIRTLERVDYVTAGEGEQRLYIFNSGDGYDATRLLLGDVLATWARALPGNLVIGIPNRDFLIGFSDANPEILERIAQQIQADSAGREYGLTEQLFTLESGQVRE
ncbi:MAG TPA: DUF1444 family protein, partial [Roseiflexaceae bacterium]|nr:DUF1444 family protein [Roseiflexaceae bacterium]